MGKIGWGLVVGESVGVGFCSNRSVLWCQLRKKPEFIIEDVLKNNNSDAS